MNSKKCKINKTNTNISIRMWDCNEYSLSNLQPQMDSSKSQFIEQCEIRIIDDNDFTLHVEDQNALFQIKVHLFFTWSSPMGLCQQSHFRSEAFVWHALVVLKCAMMCSMPNNGDYFNSTMSNQFRIEGPVMTSRFPREGYNACLIDDLCDKSVLYRPKRKYDSCAATSLVIAEWNSLKLHFIDRFTVCFTHEAHRDSIRIQFSSRSSSAS
jgi:hypothetical protein